MPWPRSEITSPPILSEGWTYAGPDGRIFNFDRVSGRYIMDIGGTGMPPVEYITTKSPYQHGETVHDYQLGTRMIQCMVRRMFRDRDAWWTGRNTLLDELRPNRAFLGIATPGVLQVTRGDFRRAIECYIGSGPEFAPMRARGKWDEWAIQEVLRFTAYNPIWYDPREISHEFSVNVDELVFPITFPITFGSLDETYDLTYTGTWPEYPCFYFYGPMQNPRIDNESTGEWIQLNYDIPAGSAVHICLQPGHKFVEMDGADAGVPLLLGSADPSFVNLIGYLNVNSNLVAFHLEPDPGVPDGINSIRITANGVNADSQAVMYWYHRYIGI